MRPTARTCSAIRMNLLLCPLHAGVDYFVAAQTTQDRSVFEETARLLQERLAERLTVLDTICDATRQRQKETIALAKQVELVIVVGRPEQRQYAAAG